MDDTGQGRLAVVIGGGNGIGAATARLMAARGWRLAIIDRDLEAARAVAAELHARAFHGDVTDAAVMHGVAQEIEATVAPPYALVVSSGTFQDPVPPGQTTLEDWDRIMRVNLDGVFFANRAFGPGRAWPAAARGRSSTSPRSSASAAPRCTPTARPRRRSST